MRPHALKHLKPQNQQNQRRRPEIDGHRRPLKKPVPGQHAVSVPGCNIVKRVQLKYNRKPRRPGGEDRLVIHDRRQPHPKLQAYAYNLRHILKKDLNRAGKVRDRQPEHGCREGIIEDLKPHKFRSAAAYQVEPQHDRQKAGMHHKTGNQLNKRQMFHLEHDFLDEIVVFLKAVGSCI